jgi:hypothetical protein
MLLPHEPRALRGIHSCTVVEAPISGDTPQRWPRPWFSPPVRRASVVGPGGLTDQSPVVTRVVYVIVSAAIATSDLPPSGRTAPRSGGSEARAARRRGYGRRGRPPISHFLSIWTRFAEQRELACSTPLERLTTSPIRLRVLSAAEPFRAPALVQSRPQPIGPQRDSRAVVRLPSRR